MLNLLAIVSIDAVIEANLTYLAIGHVSLVLILLIVLFTLGKKDTTSESTNQDNEAFDYKTEKGMMFKPGGESKSAPSKTEESSPETKDSGSKKDESIVLEDKVGEDKPSKKDEASPESETDTSVTETPTKSESQPESETATSEETEKRKLDRIKEILSQESEHAIIVINRDEMIQDLNTKAFDLLQYTKEDLNGKKIDEIVFLEASDKSDTTGSDDTNTKQVAKGQRKDGKRFPVSVELEMADREFGIIAVTLYPQSEVDTKLETKDEDASTEVTDDASEKPSPTEVVAEPGSEEESEQKADAEVETGAEEETEAVAKTEQEEKPETVTEQEPEEEAEPKAAEEQETKPEPEEEPEVESEPKAESEAEPETEIESKPEEEPKPEPEPEPQEEPEPEPAQPEPEVSRPSPPPPPPKDGPRKPLLDYPRRSLPLAKVANNALVKTTGPLDNKIVEMFSTQLSQPLQSIVQLAELISNDENAIPQLKKYAIAIQAKSNRMMSQMDEMSMLVSAQKGQLQVLDKPFNLSRMITGLVDLATSVMIEKKQNIQYSCDEQDLIVVSDEDHFEKILSNLISVTLHAAEEKDISLSLKSDLIDENKNPDKKISYEGRELQIGSNRQIFIRTEFPTDSATHHIFDIAINRGHDNAILHNAQNNGSLKNYISSLRLMKELIRVMGGKLNYISDDAKKGVIEISLELQCAQVGSYPA